MMSIIFLFPALFSQFEEWDEFSEEYTTFDTYIGESLVGSTERAAFLLEKDPHIPPSELANDWKMLLSKHVKAGDTVLDYGARAGDFALPLSKMVGSDGNVVAIEPDLPLFRGLFWNLVRAHRKNVKIFSLALNQPIDDLELPKISLMRVDANGREDLFLRGAEETLRRFKPTLLIRILGEINIERADRYIQEEYVRRLEGIHELGYDTQQLFGSWYLGTYRE